MSTSKFTSRVTVEFKQIGSKQNRIFQVHAARIERGSKAGSNALGSWSTSTIKNSLVYLCPANHILKQSQDSSSHSIYSAKLGPSRYVRHTSLNRFKSQVSSV